MSFTFKQSKNAIPIAKIRDSDKILYILNNSDVFMELPKKNVNSHTYKCPWCKVTIASKQGFIYHVEKSCEKKKSVVMDTKPVIELPKLDEFIIIPQPLEEHNVIMVTGKPKCGKSYWVNEYVKAFKTINPTSDVYRITTVDKDMTIINDEDKYTTIPIQVLEKNELSKETFENSLTIFDDIESARFKKGTDRAYALLGDLSKAGRHIKCDVIFANQESRMGVKSKKILSCLTHLVIFPRGCSVYQYSRLLKEHVGLSKNEISKILNLDSRWIMIAIQTPQYVIHQHGAYIIGKDIYK